MATTGSRRTAGIFMALLIGAIAPRPLMMGADQSGPVRTVPSVDLTRYVGDWFEIARFPNRFQRQCLGDVKATYVKRADGRVDVINRCRTEQGTTEARGLARVVEGSANAKLEVRFAPAALSFLPFVWGDYWILGLADDYTWAVVGSADRGYLWLLARTPQVSEAVYAQAIAIAERNGFDVRKLVRTPQSG